MNVTEKQKEIIICFMQDHPEFGRGRLRYNSENKRKIDELWEKLSTILNTAACGPYKSAKEWSKTWRDWKSNTLKKVAKHKTYMMGTGGGSPKHLQLTGIEKALIDFLTPDASGLTGIPEGGIEDIMSSSSYNEPSALLYNTELEETQEMSLNEISEMDLYQMQSCTLQKKHAQLENNEKIWDSIDSPQSCTKQKRQPVVAKNIQSNIGRERYFDSSIRNIQDIQIENKENILEHHETRAFSKQLITAKYSEDVKKPRLMATAIDLLEKKSSTSENIKQKMLELKQEKLKLIKEELTINKEILQQLQNMNNQISCLREELIGQYLQEKF